MREQREKGAEKTSNKRVHGNCGVRIETIAVNEIAHALPERHHATKTYERGCEDLRPRGDVWVGGPSEPKETDWKCDGTDNHGWEALFWNRFAMLVVGFGEVCCGRVGDERRTHHNSHNKGRKWKIGHPE